LNFRQLALITFICFSIQTKADEFVYSLKLDESFDSIRGKLNFKWSTTELDWILISLETIPGAPRYVTNSDLFFQNRKLAGVMFTIDPRISDFGSYEERSKFLVNSFTTLAEKLNEKYKSISHDIDEAKYVDCSGAKSYDFSKCKGTAQFKGKHKLVELSYIDNKIYLSIASSKKFKKINEMFTGALLAAYASHLNSYMDAKEYESELKKRQGINLDEKSFDLESAEIEIKYSDVP
jgi:hypothetical protein